MSGGRLFLQTRPDREPQLRPIAPLLSTAVLALTACTEARETERSAEARERAGFAQTAREDRVAPAAAPMVAQQRAVATAAEVALFSRRSEEHTSELQSRLHLVCRLLLEKQKQHHTHKTCTLS